MRVGALAILLAVLFPAQAVSQVWDSPESERFIREQLPEGWLDVKPDESGLVVLVGNTAGTPVELPDTPYVLALQEAGLSDVAVKQLRVSPGKYEVEIPDLPAAVSFEAVPGKMKFLEIYKSDRGGPPKVVFYDSLPETTASVVVGLEKSGYADYLSLGHIDPADNVIQLQLSTETPWLVPKPTPSPPPQDD